MFYSYRQKDKLHDKLKYKFPMLKEDDLNLLCLNILKSKEKQSVLDSLGLEKEEKLKKEKDKKKEKISFKTLIEENFSMMDI